MSASLYLVKKTEKPVLDASATVKGITKLSINPVESINPISVGDNDPRVLNVEHTTNKDTTNGYAGLTLLKINFKNVSNSINSFLTNANTAARTYLFPDKDGTAAMLSDITTSHGALTGLSIDDHPQYALLSGRPGWQVLIGSTTPNNGLVLRANSGISGGDIIFQVGNNGATEALRISNSGRIGINMAPVAFIDCQINSNAQEGLQINNISGGTFRSTRIDIGTDIAWTGPYCTFAVYPSNFYIPSAAGLATFGANNVVGFAIASTGYIRFQAGSGFPERMRILATGETGLGVTAPTATLHLKAGVATASGSPLKLTPGINLNITEQGAVEYNGVNLFFTRVSARENVLCSSAVNVISPTLPNRTITINIDGVTYYLSAKTTND